MMARLTKKQREKNEERARRGYHILYGYREDQDKGEPFDTVLTDLLADLMHSAEEEKIPFAECVQTAQMHYNAEKNGEG